MKKRILTALLAALLAAFSAAGAAFDAASPYVTDGAGVLSAAENTELADRAAEIAESYNCGVYLMTVDALPEGWDAYEYAVNLYTTYDLGLGKDRDGELLLLSFEDRDYALVYHGWAETAFTDYGRDSVEDAMLDDFRKNDWYGGFRDYLEESAYLLEAARNGSPVDDPNASSGSSYDPYGGYSPNISISDGAGYTESGVSSGNGRRGGLSWGMLLVCVLLPCLISFLICMGLKAGMTSVRHASQAGNYVPKGGFLLRVSSDTFTHATHTRVKVREDPPPQHDSGSTHHSGGEFSGRSGKF